VSISFASYYWLGLLPVILLLINGWRKEQPQQFAIGGLFAESGHKVSAQSEAALPTWWIWLVMCCVFAVLALAKPVAVSSVSGVGVPTHKFISSAVPISKTTAQAVVVDQQRSLALQQLQISDSLSINLERGEQGERWQSYKFPEVVITLPQDAQQARELFLAAWPLTRFKEDDYFSFSIEQKNVDAFADVDFSQPLTAQVSSLVIHDFRQRIHQQLESRSYLPTTELQTQHPRSFARLAAIIATACAVLSLWLFKRR
jgi:hypothetical protein